jgi:hypothetical protein
VPSAIHLGRDDILVICLYTLLKPTAVQCTSIVTVYEVYDIKCRQVSQPVSKTPYTVTGCQDEVSLNEVSLNIINCIIPDRCVPTLDRIQGGISQQLHVETWIPGCPLLGRMELLSFIQVEVLALSTIDNMSQSTQL